MVWEEGKNPTQNDITNLGEIGHVTILWYKGIWNMCRFFESLLNSRRCRCHQYLGVSKNNGTPKSSSLIGFSIINHPFWGTFFFWKHPFMSYQLPTPVVETSCYNQGWVVESHRFRDHIEALGFHTEIQCTPQNSRQFHLKNPRKIEIRVQSSEASTCARV